MIVHLVAALMVVEGVLAQLSFALATSVGLYFFLELVPSPASYGLLRLVP